MFHIVSKVIAIPYKGYKISLIHIKWTYHVGRARHSSQHSCHNPTLVINPKQTIIVIQINLIKYLTLK